MNRPVTFAAVCAFTCAGFWFFADTIIWSQEKRALLERQVREETVIQVGNRVLCGVKVNLSVWPELNQLEIYRWVVACEDKLDE